MQANIKQKDVDDLLKSYFSDVEFFKDKSAQIMRAILSDSGKLDDFVNNLMKERGVK